MNLFYKINKMIKFIERKKILKGIRNGEYNGEYEYYKNIINIYRALDRKTLDAGSRPHYGKKDDMLVTLYVIHQIATNCKEQYVYSSYYNSIEELERDRTNDFFVLIQSSNKRIAINISQPLRSNANELSIIEKEIVSKQYYSRSIKKAELKLFSLLYDLIYQAVGNDDIVVGYTASNYLINAWIDSTPNQVYLGGTWGEDYVLPVRWRRFTEFAYGHGKYDFLDALLPSAIKKYRRDILGKFAFRENYIPFSDWKWKLIISQGKKGYDVNFKAVKFLFALDQEWRDIFENYQPNSFDGLNLSLGSYSPESVITKDYAQLGIIHLFQKTGVDLAALRTDDDSAWLSLEEMNDAISITKD